MEFSIKEYSKYNESEILNLYQSVGKICAICHIKFLSPLCVYRSRLSSASINICIFYDSL